MNVISELEDIIRGRLGSVVKIEVTFNKKYLRNFNKEKHISTGVCPDVNALYK